MEAVKPCNKLIGSRCHIDLKFRMTGTESSCPVVESDNVKHLQFLRLQVSLQYIEFCHGICQRRAGSKEQFPAIFPYKITFSQHPVRFPASFRIPSRDYIRVAFQRNVLIVMTLIYYQKIDSQLVKTICTLISIVLNEFILFPDQTLIVGSKTA